MKQPQSLKYGNARGNDTVFPDGGMGSVQFKQQKDSQKRTDEYREQLRKSDLNAQMRKDLSIPLDGWSVMYPRMTEKYQGYLDSATEVYSQAEQEGRGLTAEEQRQLTQARNDFKLDAQFSLEMQKYYNAAKTRYEKNPDKYKRAETEQMLKYVTNPEQHAADTGRMKELNEMGWVEYSRKYIMTEPLTRLAVNPLSTWEDENAAFLKDITKTTDDSWENADASGRVKTIERSKAQILNKMNEDYMSNQSWAENVNEIAAERKINKNQLFNAWANNWAIEKQKTLTDFEKKASKEEQSDSGSPEEYLSNNGFNKKKGELSTKDIGEDGESIERSREIRWDQHKALPATKLKVNVDLAEGGDQEYYISDIGVVETVYAMGAGKVYQVMAVLRGEDGEVERQVPLSEVEGVLQEKYGADIQALKAYAAQKNNAGSDLPDLSEEDGLPDL